MRSAALTGNSDDRRPPRKREPEDSEESRPSRASSRGRTPNRGFAAADRITRDRPSGDTFKVPEKKTKVVVFLEPENYDAIYRHWVPQKKDDGKTVKVPINCINGLDERGCPLCRTGEEPRIAYLFNVADLDDPGKVYRWEASAEPYSQIIKLYQELQEIPEERGGPLELDSPGVYAAVSRSQKTNRYWEYFVKRVKERDLDEDYALDPIPDEQLRAMKSNLFTSDDLKFISYAEMKELAAELED